MSRPGRRWRPPNRLLADYTDAELELLARFLSSVRELDEDNLARVRGVR